jgi:hypothetical protein
VCKIAIDLRSVKDQRSFDRILITFELDLNLFCDGFHVWFPIVFSILGSQKISRPVCVQQKQGGLG